MNELNKLIQEYGVSGLAKKLNISRQTIYNYVNGKHEIKLKVWESIKELIKKI